MEINDTVIKNIRKEIESHREEIADREEKIKVLMESIDFEEDNLAATITKKYAGRYFLAKDSTKDTIKLFKFKKFERNCWGWFICGDCFWYTLGQKSFFSIEPNYNLSLKGMDVRSIANLTACFEQEYMEITKEEFQKYKDAATKNFIEKL